MRPDQSADGTTNYVGGVDDREVIEAFLDAGSGIVFGPSLHVERDTLSLDGWWPVAYRVCARTVIVRDEDTPTDSTILTDLATALTAIGLRPVGTDLPAISLLTYTILDLGYAPWALWSTDLATGEADLNAKASEETFLQGGSIIDPPIDFDNTDSARVARRLAGAASRVVLTVGVSDAHTASLRDGLEDCRLENRDFGEIDPAECSSVLPTLMLVDATGPTGQAFLFELQAAHPVRSPVVAITTDGAMAAGADATVDASSPPSGWIELLRDLLR